jgi:RNA polymerase sigma-70 factor (ECF subfamily)
MGADRRKPISMGKSLSWTQSGAPGKKSKCAAPFALVSQPVSWGTVSMDFANTDPEELLRAARAQGPVALGPLLELYRSYLTLLARLQIGRRLQSKVDAADLVQETFLKAYRDFGQFRGTTERELATWLRQILATNLAMVVRRYLGTQRRDARLEQELAEDLNQSSGVLHRGLLAPHSSPSQQAARREQAVLLANALDRLPADYREVIILRHLEERTFPEVARHMDRTVDSVKKLWMRALVRLRRSLGESL